MKNQLYEIFNAITMREAVRNAREAMGQALVA